MSSLPECLTQLVERQVARGRSIAQIAAEVGYGSPRLLEMFMSGRARVPLDKSYALARALDTNPAAFFRDVLRQFWPVDETTLDAVVGEPVTDEGRRLLHDFRSRNSSMRAGTT